MPTSPIARLLKYLVISENTNKHKLRSRAVGHSKVTNLVHNKILYIYYAQMQLFKTITQRTNNFMPFKFEQHFDVFQATKVVSLPVPLIPFGINILHIF